MKPLCHIFQVKSFLFSLSLRGGGEKGLLVIGIVSIFFVAVSRGMALQKTEGSEPKGKEVNIPLPGFLLNTLQIGGNFVFLNPEI